MYVRTHRHTHAVTYTGTLTDTDAIEQHSALCIQAICIAADISLIISIAQRFFVIFTEFIKYTFLVSDVILYSELNCYISYKIYKYLLAKMSLDIN